MKCVVPNDIHLVALFCLLGAQRSTPILGESISTPSRTWGLAFARACAERARQTA